MKPEDICFIGQRGLYSSIKIFSDLAKRLDVDFFKDNDPKLKSKKLAVCIKPFRINFEGFVIWIPIDGSLPPFSPDMFLCCSRNQEKAVKEKFTDVPTRIIPHYHANISGRVYPLGTTDKWIGTNLWEPRNLPPLVERIVVDSRYEQNELECIYGSSRFLINTRNKRRGYENHLRWNTGIKSLNAIGFHKPAISEPEPALLEWGEDCGLFLEQGQTVQDAIVRLSLDKGLRDGIVKNCKARSSDFSIENVARQFEKLFEQF